MPFSITCPECSVKLKTASAIPSGRSIQCPKCRQSFAVSADNMVEVDTSANGDGTPSPTRKTANAPNPFGGLNAPAGRKSRPGDDDEPKSRARKPSNSDDDEDDDRLSTRKRRTNDDDDDDRPSIRKRRPADDDDDEPPAVSRKRRVVDDEDDEDRPSSRARRTKNDDDDDDRPRRPKPKKKKKKSNLGVIIGASVFGLLLLTGVGFGLYWIFGGGGVDTEMLAFLPADTNFMVGVDVEDLMDNDKVKGMVKKFTDSPTGKGMLEQMKKAGLTENDFGSVLYGGKVDLAAKGPGPGDAPVAYVVRFKKSFDKAKLVGALEATEQKKNDKSFYKSKGGHGYYYFPSDTMMVEVSSEKQIDTILANPDKVSVSDEMRDLAKKMSKGQIWLAIGRTFFEGQGKNAKDQLPFMVPKNVTERMQSIRGAGFHLKLDDDKLSMGVGVVFSDSKPASDSVDEFNKAMKDNSLKSLTSIVPPDYKSVADEFVNSLKATASGSLFEVTASVSISAVEGPLNKLFAAPQPQPVNKVEQPQVQNDNQPPPDKKANQQPRNRRNNKKNSDPKPPD